VRAQRFDARAARREQAALGAAPENARAERVYDDIEAGVLAMDAYLFH